MFDKNGDNVAIGATVKEEDGKLYILESMQGPYINLRDTETNDLKSVTKITFKKVIEPPANVTSGIVSSAGEGPVKPVESPIGTNAGGTRGPEVAGDSKSDKGKSIDQLAKEVKEQVEAEQKGK